MPRPIRRSEALARRPFYFASGTLFMDTNRPSILTSSPRDTKLNRRRRSGRISPRLLESLELRQLMAVGAVPDTIDVATATSWLVPPGLAETSLTAPAPGTSRHLLKFTVDAHDATVPSKFQLRPSTSNSSADAALSLYDASGNRLVTVDSDSLPGKPGQEELQVDLQTEQVYYLSIQFAAGVSDSFTLMTDTIGQQTNDPLVLSASTGETVFAAIDGDDAFQSPQDVDYFPLFMFNGGATGQVMLQPTGLDTHVQATLYRKDHSEAPWKAIASGVDLSQEATGDLVTLPVLPANGRHLTDSEYLLAVAPRSFDTAARSYEVRLQANSLLVSGQLAPSERNAASDLGILLPAANSRAATTVETDMPPSGNLFRFRAPTTGSLQLRLNGPDFEPIVSLYAADGQLLHVASRSTSGTVQSQFSVVANQDYFVRVSDVANNQGGNLSLQLSMLMAPELITFPVDQAAAVFEKSGLVVSSTSGGRFFQVATSSQLDVLVIEVDPGASAPTAASRVAAYVPGVGVVQAQAAAGTPLHFPLMVQGKSGYVDFYIETTGGQTPVTLRVGQIDVPDTMPIAAFDPARLNLSGDLDSTDAETNQARSQSATSFGQPIGLRYHTFLGEPSSGPTVFRATGLASQPLLARYDRVDGQFRLRSFQLPDATTGVATLSSPTASEQLQGVLALPLRIDLDSAASVEFEVDGPNALPVGVSMVNDLTAPPAAPRALLRIDDVQLEDEQDQDLWKTALPFHLTPNGRPSIVFQPKVAPDDLRVRLTVYREDGTLLAQRTSAQPGSKIEFTLGEELNNTSDVANFVESLRGQTLLFRIEPLAGFLGDGTYRLEMRADTGVSQPFEVFEDHWQFPGGATVNCQPYADGTPCKGTFPVVADSSPQNGIPDGIVVDVIQDPFGRGSVEGTFTSSLPYNTGSTGNAGAIDVYRFWAVNEGSVVVRTVPIDPQVNTNLQIYRAVFDNQGNVSYLRKVGQGAAGENLSDLDWFPSDRSEIDAQAYVNDFEMLKYSPGQGCAVGSCYGTGGGMYFAVVKNEQGTQGRYRLEVDTASFPLLGGVNPTPAVPDQAFAQATKDPIAWIHPSIGGSLNLQLRYLERFTDFVGYFPVQLPDNHDGTLQLSSSSGSRWRFNVFDAAGRAISGSQQFDPSSQSMRGTYTVSPGPQTVYVRLQEIGDNPNTAFVNVNVGVQLPAGVTAPPTNLPLVPTAAPLATNAFGDGVAIGTATALGARQSYAFRAPAGRLQIQVQPSAQQNGVQLRYAVYVEGALRAWDQTPVAEQWEQQSERFSTNLTLPLVRQPRDTTDDGFDQAADHDVVVMVEPVGTLGAMRQYSVVVQSNQPSPHCDVPDGNLTANPDFECAARLPMQNQILKISSLTGISDAKTATGWDWIRLDVPANITAGTVRLQAGNQGSVRYWLYDVEGNQISTSQSSANPNIQFTLPVNGGASYYLRISRMDAGSTLTTPLSIQVTATLPKATQAGLGRPAAVLSEVNPASLRRATPSPDGQVDVNFLQSARLAFWVDRPGVATFNTVLDNQPNRFVALYRASRECNEFCDAIEGTLVDYTNHLNATFGINYNLTAYLQPGMYFLDSNDPSPWYRANLPDYRIREIVLDPETGISDQANLYAFDRARSAFDRDEDLLESYRSTYYHVQTPVGSQAGVMTFASSFSCEDTLENGTGTLALWRVQDDQYITVSSAGDQPILNDPQNACGNGPDATVSSPLATPFQDFYVAFHRSNLINRVATSAIYEVPNSGLPDLVVEPIRVFPADGQTRVEVTVRNVGYAPALRNWARFEADSAATPGLDIPASPTDVVKERTLAARSSRTHIFYFDPDTKDDTFRYITDYVQGNAQGSLEELNELNNSAQRALCQVSQSDNVGNCHAPTISVSIADAQLDGTGSNDAVWGRYISGVFGVESDLRFQWSDQDDLLDTDRDGQTDLYRATGYRPARKVEAPSANGLIFFLDPGENEFPNFDFGDLHPTTANNANQLRVRAMDRYGLESPEFARTVQVIGRPGWLSGDSTIEYDADSRQYEIHFRNELIHYNETVDDILNLTVPFVGDKRNEFLVELRADTIATLDPTDSVTAPVTAHVLLKVLNNEIFNQTYGGSQPVTDQVAVTTNVAIHPVTLEATAFGVGVELDDLDLYEYQSPEIRLFSYGISGVASLNANLYFTVDAALDAGVTVAINPNVIQNPVQPPTPLGLLAPTFLQPSVTLGANVEGEVEIIGFDLASLSGGLNFTLQVTVGLDETDSSQVVPFDQLSNNLCVDVSGNVGIEFGADVLGIEVWGYEKQFPNFQIASSCNDGIVTHDGVVGQRIGQLVAEVVKAMGILDGFEGLAEIAETGDGETVPAGSSIVGSLAIEPSPQIVIDPQTGRGYYLQVIDPEPNDGIASGRLAFARRNTTGADWTSLTTIPGNAHVSTPALAFTNSTVQGGATQAVAVYAALNASAQPSSLTRSEFLKRQDIRYRFYDGQIWSEELSLTNDDRFDSNPIIAFNRPADGTPAAGVLAWTRNQNPSPLSDQGILDRTANSIMVSLWDATSHQWLPPIELGSSGVSDSQAAVYVDEQRHSYVTWLQDTPNGNRVFYSRHDGVHWSLPAELPTLGLPAGGEIRSLAIGSEGPGRIDVLMTHVMPSEGADRPATSTLYNRPTLVTRFGQPTAVETIASNANFSHLQTLATPDGSLIAYWQQSDGVTNEVFSSRIGPPGQGPIRWTTPSPVTSGESIEYDPSLAVDSDGSLVLVHANKSPVLNVAEPANAQADGPTVNATDASLPPVSGVATTQRRHSGATLQWDQRLVFAGQSIAATGSLATASAVLKNWGDAAVPILVEHFVGLPGPGDVPVLSQTALVGAFATYDLSPSFQVQPNTHDYCIRVRPDLARTDADFAPLLSCRALTGEADLQVSNLIVEPAQWIAGSEATLSVRVQNQSSIAMADARVVFRWIDPTNPSQPITIASSPVAPLAAFQARTVSAVWNVPNLSRSSDLWITATVETESRREEVSSVNNEVRIPVSLRADASLSDRFSDGVAFPAVKATLLNRSGRKNVAVDVTVRNLGNASLTQVPVRLFRTLDDENTEEVSVHMIDQLLPQGQQTIRFIVDGLAGLHRFQAIVDSESGEVDLTNQANETALRILGWPDLRVGKIEPVLQSDAASAMGAHVRATIENLGIAAARSVRVELFFGNPEENVLGAPAAILLGSTPLEIVPALQSSVTAIPMDLTKIPAGANRTLCVVVNRDSHIMESSEANNVSCLQVTVPPRLPGDVNGDGRLSVLDLDAMCLALHQPWFDARYDVNGDIKVNGDDFDRLLTILGSKYGDANLDGSFDSADLIQVFQAGQYDDGIFGNSTWAQGDWNCDGEFDTSDLIKAFQQGGYVSKLLPALAKDLSDFAIDAFFAIPEERD